MQRVQRDNAAWLHAANGHGGILSTVIKDFFVDLQSAKEKNVDPFFGVVEYA